MLEQSAISAREPEVFEMPPQKMAVVYTKGDPNEVQIQAMRALYLAVYDLKFALKREGRRFKIRPLRARWPDTQLLPKDQWTGIWGLHIPEDTTRLDQKVPGVEVRIEVWKYGTVAQLLHIGQYSTEMTTVKRLHDFIAASGYEIAGVHEEEYLTTPRAKYPKTIIRYPIKKHDLNSLIEKELGPLSVYSVAF